MANAIRQIGYWAAVLLSWLFCFCLVAPIHALYLLIKLLD